MFAQDLKVDASTTFSLPCTQSGCLTLKIAGKCRSSRGHTKRFKRLTVRCPIKKTVTISDGCRNQCDLRMTGSRGNTIDLGGVLHWSWRGNAFWIWPSTGVSVNDINGAFSNGESVVISKANSGKPDEDNLALAHVHGADAQNDASPRRPTRIRYGLAGNIARDYTVYTINPFPTIRPGETYFYRQYFVVDSYTKMDAHASSWVDETYQGKVPQGQIKGRTVQLVSSGKGTFATTLDSETTCPGASRECEGMTTPQVGAKPLYFVECGSQHYVGSDPYALSQARSSALRSYRCRDNASLRPRWSLLGYFSEGSCDTLRNAAYDPAVCPSA